MTVYRYEINDPSGVNHIEIQAGATPLNVGCYLNEEGKEVISVWVACNSEDSKQVRTFIVAGTGANLDNLINFNYKYIGTVQKSNKYAFHVFEVDNDFNF